MSGAASTLWDRPEPSDVRRWGVAFVLVLALHLAGAVALLSYRHSLTEAGEGLPAVLVDMAPPPAAPMIAPDSPSPAEPVPEAATPEPVRQAPPETPVEAPPPQEVKAPATVSDTPPPPANERAEVTLPPLPMIQPKTQPPKPRAADRKLPKPVEAKRAERREEHRPPREAAGAQTTASAPSASTGLSAASRSSWQGAIVAALNRAKRPQVETGLASVRFSIDRNGRVLSAGLAGSAGAPGLDAEAVALVRRAGIPPAPSDVPGSSFSFTVPIRFSSR